MNVDQVHHLGEIRSRTDAEFIAYAREYVPWLLALVDDLVAENGRLREFIDPDHGVWRIGKSLEQAISEVGGDAARGERNPDAE